MSDSNITPNNNSETESVQSSSSQNTAKNDESNIVTKNLTEINKHIESASNSITRMWKHLDESSAVDEAYKTRHLSATNIVDKKCEDIQSNMTLVNEKLENIAMIATETSSKVDDLADASPSYTQFSNMEHQIALLNAKFSSVSIAVKKQSADAEFNCKRVMANSETIRSSLIAYFDMQDHVSNQHNTVETNCHSTPQPENRFNQSQIPSNIFEESAELARGGVAHTPARTAGHEKPDRVQTRAQINAT